MSTLDELLAKTKTLPPMRESERRLQKLDFAYGNLACSTNHKPKREAFRYTALVLLGITSADFEAWADTKEWA